MSAGRAFGAAATRIVCGAIRGRNPGGHPAGGLDRDGEIGAVHRTVHRRHRREIELPCALLGDRHADQAATESRHEIDDVGRHHVRCHHQVAFVFAILLVDQDDHAAGPDLRDDLGNRADRAGLCRVRSRRVDRVQAGGLHGWLTGRDGTFIILRRFRRASFAARPRSVRSCRPRARRRRCSGVDQR